MVNFAVLNELSLPIGNTMEEAEGNIEIFIKLLRKLKIKNIDTIRSLEDIRNLNVTPSKKIYEYIPSIENKDLKRRIITMIANNIIGFENPLYKENEIDDIESIEYKYNGELTLGLGVADMFETLSISFNNNDKWKTSNLLINKHYIDKDGEINIIEDIKVKNIYSEESINTFDDYFETLFTFKYPIDKRNFRELKNKVFQNIKFCKDIDEQVKNLDSEVFKSFLQKLILIELEIKSINDFNFSGESDSVKNTDKYKKLRMFSHEDLGEEKVYFDNHLKSLPNGSRMYFLEKNNIVYIGYIGKHLSTKNF